MKVYNINRLAAISSSVYTHHKPMVRHVRLDIVLKTAPLVANIRSCSASIVLTTGVASVKFCARSLATALNARFTFSNLIKSLIAQSISQGVVRIDVATREAVSLGKSIVTGTDWSFTSASR